MFAVFSTLMHAGEEGILEQFEMTVEACELVEQPLANVYIDVMVAALSEANRTLWEKKMREGHKYVSDFANQYYAKGREAGREEERVSLVLELAAAKLERVPPDLEARLLEVEEPRQLKQLLFELACSVDPEAAASALARNLPPTRRA